MKIKKKVSKLISDISQKLTSPGLSQDMTSANGEKYQTPGIGSLIRQAGAEGIVLLKNNGILPLKNTDTVSVFGRCQYNWFYVGYGSGGDVNPAYKVNLIDAMRNSDIRINDGLAEFYEKWCNIPNNVPDDGFWGHWPMCYDEMPLHKEMVTYSSVVSNVALVVIGRAAGEDRENKLEKGSYYLTDTEEKNLNLICDAFEKVIVVMDCGNIIDMSWTEKYGDKLSAVIYSWQGGQESGNSLTDILSGKVNPSGKLSDTIARNYDDYPSGAFFGGKDRNVYTEDIFVGYRYFETFAKEKVLYPFGFGLSYTDFSIETESFEHNDNATKLSVKVTNTGSVTGKETVQIYAGAPQGVLGKPAKVLAAFAKTEDIEPGKSVTLNLEFSDYVISSYDDEGLTGHSSSYVLEKGEYTIYAGNSVRTENVAGTFIVEEDKVLEKLEPVCPVKATYHKMTAVTENGKVVPVGKRAFRAEMNLRQRILDNMPEAVGEQGYKNIKIQDVKEGKATLDEFVSQLTPEELEGLTRGNGNMNSPYGVNGNAGAFGGITDALRSKYDIPAMITCDGPAGIRIGSYAALLPCGTALACTWNTELVQQLFSLIAEELDHYEVDVLLSPGMNIHRNPLCGRNFEYYSEDPVLSGKTSAAAVRGIQSKGASACPKHFACNNQEYNRNKNDSILTERALREIYLKGFEIVVKESEPENIMTSYNKINGVWSHYNYDLVTTVLRKEWGYKGNIVTDWWMQRSQSPEFPEIRDNAYRVRAQVDVFMPGNFSKVTKQYDVDESLLETLGTENGITRGELERSAKNVLRFILKRLK